MNLSQKSLTIGVFLALSGALTCLGGSISIQGPLINPTEGDSFNVNIVGTNLTDLYAFQFDLSYNPVLVSATSIAEGALLPSGGATFFVPGVVDNLGGAVTFTADSLLTAISGVTGSGVLATIQFTALSGGTTALSLSDITLLDSALADITATASGASVTIDGSSSVPEPATIGIVLLCLVLLVCLKRLVYLNPLFSPRRLHRPSLVKH